MAAQERRSKAASRRKSPAKRKPAQQPQQAPQQAKQAPGSAKGSDGLTEQQRQFVRAYTLHRNATQAAIDAGYSKATAQQQGSRLLSHVVVKAAIEQVRVDEQVRTESHIAQVVSDLDLTVERLLREAMRIAFFDIRKLYGPDGSLKALHELDDDTAAAITGIDVQELWGGSGEDRQVIGVVKKWKAAAKDKALDMLFKHRNLYAADNDGKVQPFAEALAGFLGSLHSQGGSRLPIRPPVARKP